MIRFSNWIISPQREVIARQHDNLTGRLEVLGDLPEGWIWDMLVRVGHYRDVLSLTPCDGGVGIDLSAEMLCVGGSYTMQLRGTQGELVRHTNQVTVYIPASLSGDEWWPELPSEFSQAEQRVRECVEQATQEANRAEDGADAAQKDAEAAKGAANQAEQSAAVAQEANKGSEAAADQAKQSAAAAQAARDGSEAAASQAGQSAAQAAQKANAAANSASDAKEAQQAVENMTASAETLAPDAQASVTKTTQDDVVNLKFGIPQGQPGQNGGYYRPSVSEDGQLAFNPSQEDMPAVPSASIKGPPGTPGQDAPQIDDSAVNTTNPWSSKQIVDTLAPEFEASGAVVTCTPVAGYPLHVVSQITPVQAGEGDPSPENVRPISGWDAANVWVGGENLLNPSGREIITNDTFTNTSKRNLNGNKLYVGLARNNYFKASAIETYSVDSNSIVCKTSSSPDSGAYGIGFDFIVVPGCKYYFSSSNAAPITFYDKDGSFISTTVFPAIAPGNAYYGVVVFSPSAVDTEMSWEGTIVSLSEIPYTPYNPASRTITLPFGQTVYGGEVDWTTGVLSVDKQYLTLKSDMNMVIYPLNGTNGIIFGNVFDEIESRIPGVCSHALVSTTAVLPGSRPDAYIWLGVNSYSVYWVRILDVLGISTVDEFKQWLDTQNVQIVCPLNSPITIQLTPTEILALSGTNTIYADTGDTTVSGREDPLTVIRRLSERIAALEFNMNLLSDYQRGDMT